MWQVILNNKKGNKMTNQVRTFEVKVECELGWAYPNALVAVRHASKKSQDTFISEDCESDYVTESAIESTAYRANFWDVKATQQAGRKSKPLINIDNEEDPTLFKVDLEHLQSIQVINSSMTPNDKIFRLIELDVKRRFA